MVPVLNIPKKRYSTAYLGNINLTDIYTYFQEELRNKKLSSWDLRQCGYESIHHFFLFTLNELYDEMVDPEGNSDHYAKYVETVTNIGLSIEVADNILKYLAVLVNEVIEELRITNKECVYIQVQEDTSLIPLASVYCLRSISIIGVDTYVPRQKMRF